jgi:NnrS protein
LVSIAKVSALVVAGKWHEAAVAAGHGLARKTRYFRVRAALCRKRHRFLNPVRVDRSGFGKDRRRLARPSPQNPQSNRRA